MIIHKKNILKYCLIAIFFVFFISLIILQLHNISLYPAKKGFDAPGHTQYIEIIKNEKRIPLAIEGWETYQAPLYYIIVSFLPTIKSIQYMNIFTWIGFCILAYFFLNRYYKNIFLSLLGVFFIGSLPMFLYLTPMISNEFFSGLIMSTTFVYYIVFFKNKNKTSFKEDIILGILMGFSLLSKATSIMLFISIIVDIYVETRYRIKKVFLHLYRVVFISLIIGG